MLSWFKESLALLFSALVFILSLGIGGYLTELANDNIVKENKLLLSGIARTQASELERRLSSAFTSTQILAHAVSQSDGNISDFDSYAANIMESIGGIANLQLAPNGIISNIYPLKGNESAIGLDILANPAYREAAEFAIKERSLIALGPVSLVQGGTAVIVRAPVFIGEDSNQFWGFASALIFLKDLVEASRLIELEQEGYSFALTRIHADSGDTLTFYHSDHTVDEQSMVQADIVLPTGTWQLCISHNNSEFIIARTSISYLVVIIISAILAVAFYLVLLQPQRLRHQVAEKTRELQQLVLRDPLTGLPNRRYLNDKLSDLLQESIALGQHGAFIYFDLDNFKSINDTIGHDVGDQVLIKVAERLQQLVSGNDTVVRLGGDEFAIVFFDLANIQQAEQKAEGILQTISALMHIGEREFRLSTSLGIATFPENGNHTLELMQNADVALYQAKQKGKNQYKCFDEQMKQTALNTHNEEQALVRAIHNNEIELYYQPQFDIKLGQIVGAEALVRWNHPERGLVFPNEFIPLAETTGHIIELGHHVIREAFAYAKRRQEINLPPIIIHVNLSSVQVADPTLLPLVKSLIQEYGIPGHYIGFEITESMVLEDMELAKHVLNRLKDLGICIAIDDFGTGFSSLNQLKNLPVDLLKIDKSFVMDLERDPDDKMIVEAITAMAHKLNLQVTAEGIESQEQLAFLSAIQCDLGQGYLVAKALPEALFNGLPQAIAETIEAQKTPALH